MSASDILKEMQLVNRQVALITELQREVAALREQTEESMLEQIADENHSSSLRIAELVQACKTLNSERNSFFDQSCTNLKRAEAAEQQLAAEHSAFKLLDESVTEQIIRWEKRAERIERLLQRWLSFHTDAAGMTPELVRDAVSFNKFMSGLDDKEQELVADTQRALAGAAESAAQAKPNGSGVVHQPQGERHQSGAAVQIGGSDFEKGGGDGTV